MDVPYQGYTIIPNSERQPDGRWLPVADLEVTYRGAVTAKPPLRATSREIRATRAEADAVAVKMAKAWIDASEREGASVEPPPEPLRKVPTRSDVAPPPVPQETRTPDAPAEAAPRARAADDSQRPALADKLDRTDVYQSIGLDSDEKVGRLTRVLAVHFLLDRLVTLVLGTKLAPSSEGDMAPLPLPTRVDLASRLGVVAPGVAWSILEVNRARDRLAHFKPAREKPGWDVSGADEIVSQAACDACVRRGIEAAQELMSVLRRQAGNPGQSH